MKKANVEEKKIAYIGKLTYKRLIERLNLPELRILEELENENDKKVYKVVSLNSSLNTKLERYIYNNQFGEFFISDGVNDTNKIKLTKILKGLWNIKNPQELDKFNKKWKNYYTNVDNIKISDCLSEIYNIEHYGEDDCSSNSSISNSCMIRKGEYYEWLDKEPNVKIAYLTDKEGVLIGRAILWYGVDVYIEGEKIKINFMDRIYSSNDYVEELFKKWAREHGFYYKKNQSYYNKKSIISPEGEEFNNAYMEFELERALDGNEKCPYMDTFTFLDEDLTILNNDDGYYKLDYTDGRGLRNTYCDYCHEEIIDTDEAVFVEGYGYICEYCLERVFVYCEDTQDYRHIDDCYYCETDDRYYYNDDDLIEIRGNYYRKDDDDVYFCEECEEWEHEKYYSSYTAIKYDDEITICGYCANSSYYIHIDNIKGDNPYSDYIEYVYYKDLYKDKKGNYWFSEEDYLESLEEEDNNDDN